MKPFVYEPPKTPLDILYIDDDVLVVNKPSGLLTVPGKELKHHDSLELRVKKQIDIVSFSEISIINFILVKNKKLRLELL